MNSFDATSHFTFRIKSKINPLPVPASQLQPRAAYPDAVVVALPRRIPLAVEIARALHLSPDVFVVQRPGLPGQRESEIAGLLSQLQQRHPDLRVTEIQKQARIGKWLNGSATEPLFRTVAWPVLVLGPHCFEEDPPRTRSRNILYATDLSAASLDALHYAHAMAKDHEAKLIVLQVEASGEGDFSEHEVVLKGLRDWLQSQELAETEGTPAKAACIVRFGKPEQKILETAAELGSGMIVMGAHGLGAASETRIHFAGRTAYEVVCSAYCPVLIVPQPHRALTWGLQSLGDQSSVRA